MAACKNLGKKAKGLKKAQMEMLIQDASFNPGKHWIHVEAPIDEIPVFVSIAKSEEIKGLLFSQVRSHPYKSRPASRVMT